MRRALQLAALSPYETHPNPMVGCVIVADGRIIGEGWHRRFGQAHAEVNAIRSVAAADEHLLTRATMYVTLEPCAHYGKTPPCSLLIVEKKIPRVVIAATDPFPKVDGRGIDILRNAGVEVTTGLLADESRQLNRRFMFAHTHRRPYTVLKWACSADGFMDADRATTPGGAPFRFSNAFTTLCGHRQRALADVILSTAATVEADNASLTLRHFPGRSPRRVIVDRRCDPAELLARLYSDGVGSVLVEAGPRFLQSLIDRGLWNEIRIERTGTVLGDRGRHPAPRLIVPPGAKIVKEPSFTIIFQDF